MRITLQRAISIAVLIPVVIALRGVMNRAHEEPPPVHSQNVSAAGPAKAKEAPIGTPSLSPATTAKVPIREASTFLEFASPPQEFFELREKISRGRAVVGRNTNDAEFTHVDVPPPGFRAKALPLAQGSMEFTHLDQPPPEFEAFRRNFTRGQR